MSSLFVAWRDPISRSWYTVGRLTRHQALFRFDYTRGALRAHRHGTFQPFASFPELAVSYSSQRLFPFFSNRLLRSSRPEYADFVSWVGTQRQEQDPIALLALSGGRRQTDSLELFPAPEVDVEGRYHLHFFIHGLSHMADQAMNRALSLLHGQVLLVARDVQNPHDPNALLLRTADEEPNDFVVIGFVPRYFAEDVGKALDYGPETVRVHVVRVNPTPAPMQFRVLCCMTIARLEGIQLFTGEAYQPISATVDSTDRFRLGRNVG